METGHTLNCGETEIIGRRKTQTNREYIETCFSSKHNISKCTELDPTFEWLGLNTFALTAKHRRDQKSVKVRTKKRGVKTIYEVVRKQTDR